MDLFLYKHFNEAIIMKIFHKQRNNVMKTKYFTIIFIRVLNYFLYDLMINYKKYISKITTLIVFEQELLSFQFFMHHLLSI